VKPIIPLVALVAGAAIHSSVTSSPPIQTAVLTVSPERTVAEFIHVCLRTGWKEKEVRKALKEADPTYVQERENIPNSVAWDSPPSSFAWDSVHAHLALITVPQHTQCALSMAADPPLNGKQVLAILRPAVEAELGHSVEENDSKFYLTWQEPGSKYVDLIALAMATDQPSQAVWYVYDKIPPGSPELKFLTPSNTPSPK
jgi:hypothetical protein